MDRKRKIKQPVSNGVAKVPVVMQMEALECGAASLAMIAAYYGKWIPLEQVRLDCGVSRDGSNARNVLRAARSYGFIAKGYRYEPEDLRKNGKFPCIIHWNFNHFVVLDGFRGKKAVINDPAKGTYTVPMKTFDESFTGICLLFEPSEAFVPSGKPQSMLSYAKKRLAGAGVAVAFVVLTTLISSLIGVINPAFSRIFLDRLLTGENPEWVTPFIVALAALGVVQIVVAWIGEVYTLKINGKMIMICGISGCLCSLIDKVFWGGSLDFLQIPTLFIFDLKDCYLTVAEVIFVVIGILNSKEISVKEYLHFCCNKFSL